jgi:hypothetical protein
MPKKKDKTIDKIEQNLFRSKDDFIVKMTDAEYNIMLRYQKTFVHWNENPDMTDSEMVDWISEKFNISRIQSYRDLSIVERLLGNVKKSSKEWTRYRITQMLLQDRKRAIEKGNDAAAIMAADKIGKYHKLDQNTEEDFDWENLENPDFEPTNDIAVLDNSLFDPKIDEKRAALRARFKANIPIDTPYTEIKDGDKK